MLSEWEVAISKSTLKTEALEASEVLIQDLASYNSPVCTSVLLFSPSKPNLQLHLMCAYS